MSDIAKAAQTVGRCGHQLGRPPFGGMPPVCALPAGHAGWHRSDEGTEWGDTSRPIVPTASRLEAAYAAGVAAGRRQAADAIRVEVERMDAVGWQGTADAYEHAARIAAGAPAEPVEEADR